MINDLGLFSCPKPLHESPWPGRLNIEDGRGETRRGKEALHDLVEQWRYGGPPIHAEGHRREAFDIMLRMPRGTDPQSVLKAAREFARAELPGQRDVKVPHDREANPHVHLSVTAASMLGERLNPRQADQHRRRETFAERLRGCGIARQHPGASRHRRATAVARRSGVDQRVTGRHTIGNNRYFHIIALNQ